MAFIKKGEVAQILQTEQYPVPAHLHNPMAERVLADPEVVARFEKVAADLKAVAPKAKDFLYFSAVMMHAAEAALLDSDGAIKKSATGEDLTSSWDTSNDTWKWVCSDPNVLPYKNANNDIFPESELVKAHKQWVGCPLCLDHQSSSVDSIRGVVVDTYYDAPKKRVIALCALDKLNYPDLARKVKTGVSHSVSMGTAVGRAICTECGRVARVESDFCDHMRNKSCYGEINVDLKPIELSIVVNGADPNAKIKHIIAAANSLAEYASQKEVQLSKLSMTETVDPEAISAIKKDLEGIVQKLTDLEGAVERVEEIEEKEEAVEHPQENEEAEDEEGKVEDDDTMSKASLEKLTVKLAGVVSGLHEKLDKLQGNMKNLKGNGEDTMTNKADLKSEAYFQGGGDVNEPTPGKPKYEKEDSDSIRDREDKQMVGAPPFPGVGAVDGLYGDDKSEKEKLLRAEKEERAMRRQAAVDRAKAALESTAYFQGGGGPNEPTPGKPKYEKEDSDSIRDKEDKQMVGAPPFPDVGAVDGLYGDDKKKKEMLLRAHLKGRFVKAANPDGSENKGESRWHIFADDKIILTATVNELTNGKTETLYDSVANKEFGKKILSIVRSNDLSKAEAILKGAQAPPAPAPPAAAPEAAPPAPAGELPMEEEPRDAGGTGDPKEELPELLTTAENTLADIRAAVEALLDEGEAGLEGFDELSEGMGAEAQKLVGLNKLSKKVAKAMLVGMKSAHHELSEQINELKMAKHVVDNRAKVRKDQVQYVDGLVADAMEDTKKVLASCYGLMGTFVKYADGTRDLEKRAQELDPWDAMMKKQREERAKKEWKSIEHLDPMNPELPGGEAEPAKPTPGAGSGLKAKKTDKAPPPPNFGTDYYPGWENDPDFPWKQRQMSTPERTEPATGISTPEGGGGTAGEPVKGRKVAPTLTSAPGYTGGPQDMGALDEGEDMSDLKVGPEGVTITPGDKLEADDGAELDTKEARAEAREKIAAKAMKWHPLLNEAHPGGGETTQLDVKPEGDLAKVERLDETNAKMMDVATAPPRVRQAAEEIQRLVSLGKIDPEGKKAPGFDELIAEGLDKDAVAYWKAYWGQAKSEGSQFASELVKEHAAKKKAEEEEAYRVKVARAYDLAHDMVRRGMLADDRTAVNAQVNELLSLSDKAFESYKRFTEKQAIQKQASMPQVGMLTGEQNVVIAGPPAARADLNAELDAAFADLPLKGRMF